MLPRLARSGAALARCAQQQLQLLPARPLRALSAFADAQAAVKALHSPPSNDDKLRLYALFKQATAGPNATPKPSMLDFVGGAKWAAWSKLGSLPAAEAQAQYVALVAQLGGGGGGGGSAPAAAAAAAAPAVPTPSGAGRPAVFRAPLDAARGIEGVFLNAPPVNALSSEVIGALSAALAEAAADPSVRAIVLGSSQPGVFSGGLDIREMAGANQATFARFWGAIQHLFLTLYPLGKPCVAAIEGASPAGGCWLALQCDHRVLLAEPRAVIGLNEVALGIVAPPWFAAPLERAVGARQAEALLQLGTLLPPERALQLGAVDELAPRGAVLGAAVEAAARYGAVPGAARHLTKLMLRRDVLALLGSPQLRAEDLARTWAFFQGPDVQEGLRLYLERLAARKK